MKPRGLIRDVLTLYLCYKVLKVWAFGAAFSFSVGLLLLVVGGMSTWFLLERFGIA